MAVATELEELTEHAIATASHCFGCTAGAGGTLA